MNPLYCEFDTFNEIPILVTEHGDKLYIEFRHFYNGDKSVSWHTMNLDQVKKLRDALTKWLDKKEQYERLMRHQQEEYTDRMVNESKRNSN